MDTTDDKPNHEECGIQASLWKRAISYVKAKGLPQFRISTNTKQEFNQTRLTLKSLAHEQPKYTALYLCPDISISPSRTPTQPDAKYRNSRQFKQQLQQPQQQCRLSCASTLYGR